MPDASQGIIECIQHYFRGLRNADMDALREAFHPDAKIIGPDDGELKVMSLERFLEFASGNAPEPDAACEIVSMQRSGHVASAVVRDQYIGRIFVDHLVLTRDNADAAWRIYTKAWHVERKL